VRSPFVNRGCRCGAAESRGPVHPLRLHPVHTGAGGGYWIIRSPPSRGQVTRMMTKRGDVVARSPSRHRPRKRATPYTPAPGVVTGSPDCADDDRRRMTGKDIGARPGSTGSVPARAGRFKQRNFCRNLRSLRPAEKERNFFFAPYLARPQKKFLCEVYRLLPSPWPS
jgi:hypothetical protein